MSASHQDLPDVTGDPEAVRIRTEAWRQLSTRLRAHGERVMDLVGYSIDGWDSTAAGEFRQTSAEAAGIALQLAEVSLTVADYQDQHAQQQRVVAEILKELAIQIAATVAMWAVAAYLPPWLAALEAYLTYFMTQVGRVLALFVAMLRGLVRFLIDVRSWIVQVTKLSWRTERMMIGYGRILYEGVRDGASDLLSNVVTTTISGKPLDPASLGISAAASVATGGLVGLVEGAGVKKVITATGELKLAGGRPVYVPNVDRTRAAIRGIGKKADRSALPTTAATQVTVSSAETMPALDRILVNRAEARALGIDLTTSGGRRLDQELVHAEEAKSHALADYLAGAHKERILRTNVADTRTAYESAVLKVTSAEAELHSYHAALESVRMCGNDASLRQATADVNSAAARHGKAVDAVEHLRDELAIAERSHRAAQAQLVDLRDRLDKATMRVNAVTGESEVRTRLLNNIHHATAEARTQLSWLDRMRYFRQHSDWTEGYPIRYHAVVDQQQTVLKPVDWQRHRLPWLGEHPIKGYGNPKEWREFIVHNGIKGIVKGSVSNGLTTAYQYAMGQRGVDDVWRQMLLGAAFGTVRGFVDGSGINRTFFQGSAEEVLWRGASKSLDRFTRGPIFTLFEDAQRCEIVSR